MQISADPKEISAELVQISAYPYPYPYLYLYFMYICEYFVYIWRMGALECVSIAPGKKKCKYCRSSQFDYHSKNRLEIRLIMKN